MTSRYSSHALLREPLLHFIVFGALVFGADHALQARRGNPQVITISPEIDQEARSIFQTSMGRAPTAAELKVMRERWVDNEVLYREGLALRVDQGDATIRERVIYKALNVMQANLALPKIDEAGLKAWFEQHRVNYDEPERYDFLEAVVSGKPTAEDLKEFVDALNTGSASDAQSGLRVFKARPRSNLSTSYGEPFTQALDKLAPGHWHALDSKDGVRVVRLERKSAGEPATYDSVKGRIYADWKDATLQQLRTDAVRDLGKKYTIAMAATEGAK
jgi:hypothetical protein